MSINTLRAVVAGHIIDRAIDTSRLLTELGVPHALIGGLAVGMHGHARATKDVGFLVGDEAYLTTTPLLVFREELGRIIQVGVTDLLAVDDRYAALTDELSIPGDGDIPVISVGVLVVMKLEANRPQDRADIYRLMTLSQDVGGIISYVKRVGPELTPRLMELISGL